MSALRDASSQLVFHYRGGGDYAQNGVPDGRVREIDTRYVDEMLKILHGRSEAPLGTPRPASERLVGLLPRLHGAVRLIRPRPRRPRADAGRVRRLLHARMVARPRRR